MRFLCEFLVYFYMQPGGSARAVGFQQTLKLPSELKLADEFQ